MGMMATDIARRSNVQRVDIASVREPSVAAPSGSVVGAVSAIAARLMDAGGDAVLLSTAMSGARAWRYGPMCCGVTAGRARAPTQGLLHCSSSGSSTAGRGARRADGRRDAGARIGWDATKLQ